MLHNPRIFDMCRKMPEISYILPEIPAHVGNFQHIPHTLCYGFLFKIDSVFQSSNFSSCPAF